MIGVDLWITNSSLTMIIAIVLIITAYKLSIERGYIVPTRIQSVVEILYETVYCLIKDDIIFTLFTYIVVLNLMGMVPYVFSAIHLALSFGIWFSFSLSAKAISLGVRLAANISAGDLLLAILSGFTWTMLAIIQIYVSTLYSFLITFF